MKLYLRGKESFTLPLYLHSLLEQILQQWSFIWLVVSSWRYEGWGNGLRTVCGPCEFPSMHFPQILQLASSSLCGLDSHLSGLVKPRRTYWSWRCFILFYIPHRTDRLTASLKWLIDTVNHAKCQPLCSLVFCHIDKCWQSATLSSEFKMYLSAWVALDNSPAFKAKHEELSLQVCNPSFGSMSHSNFAALEMITHYGKSHYMKMTALYTQEVQVRNLGTFRVLAHS